ncbi:dihydrolipoamide acetyltransferase family protein [Domibacillus mangrovi]|uniref:Dihydrolipoamide acetyltransferase component of pyruvate dehydrogenase complex n=1 Tax=Domibacillus mangrovi TaxID=1714354 RepID=A0A1Q5NZ92_9BACI|nr:branched-chain alpha-keto acid dehydrogenase subunit E2 [Domibacillus mangrovi]
MPQLGESVTEGTVSKWLVSVGDVIKKYEPVCEVTTDKVTAEVPSSFNGTILEIVAEEGVTIPVGGLICYILSEDAGNTLKTAVPDPVKQTEHLSHLVIPMDDKQRYSPAVLRLAQEHHINLSTINGTGNGGRITRKDILHAVTIKKQTAAPAVLEPSTTPFTKQTVNEKKNQTGKTHIEKELQQYKKEDKRVPNTAIRKAIASRMVTSKHEAPHAWFTIECDVTNLVHYRNQIKNEFKQKENMTLTYLPFFIKSVVESLKEFPIINSQWTDEEIIIKKAINISVAVATDHALYVPVIKDADHKSIFGLAKEVNKLAKKTREGKLTVEDMSEGTFTVNNTGSFGSMLSNPIINHPQAAILSTEAIIKRPIVINDMIAIRDMMNICLSFDHRIIDGLVCGRFLQAVKNKIEAYGSETTIY